MDRSEFASVASERRTQVWSAFALLALAAAVWLPVFDMPLLQDDFLFAAPAALFRPDDPRQPGVSRCPMRLWAPRARQSYWRPLTQNIWLAETMAWQAWPGESRPLVGHAVSFALFCLCVAAAYWLEREMWGLTVGPCAKQGVLAAQCAAVLFASRPAWFLGVAWPSAQQELIGFLFGVGAVLAVLRRKPWLGGILFAAALLSKETAILAPGILAAVLLFRRKESGLGWRSLLPFAIPLLLYAAIRYLWIQPWLEPLPLPGPI
ncbi:MAG: hypothetical protein NTW86_11750, partial [Candidatus Sumerlaeota bacterium]|nr:hypothetical protein [Candidatus Sumerlaeota bacterium]